MDNVRDRPSAETYQTRQPVGANHSMHSTNYNQPIGDPWSSGLFDCHLDQTNATMTGFLPCVTFGQISEVMDEGELTCPLGSLIYALMMPALCSQWLMGSKYRTKMRARYNLVEAPYSDIISHVFCPCCSLCQEFRELKARGLRGGMEFWLRNRQVEQQLKFLLQDNKCIECCPWFCVL